MELVASERLFMASAVMDTEPASVPMASLAPKSSTLHTTPVMLLSRPTLARTCALRASRPSFTNKFKRILVIGNSFKELPSL